jgi:hypothetical protein
MGGPAAFLGVVLLWLLATNRIQAWLSLVTGPSGQVGIDGQIHANEVGAHAIAPTVFDTKTGKVEKVDTPSDPNAKRTIVDPTTGQVLYGNLPSVNDSLNYASSWLENNP